MYQGPCQGPMSVFCWGGNECIFEKSIQVEAPVLEYQKLHLAVLHHVHVRYDAEAPFEKYIYLKSKSLL